MKREPLAALHDLYPDFTPEELVITKENLDRYLSLVWEICEEEREAKRGTQISTTDRPNLSLPA